MARGSSKPSQSALAVLELQAKLPKARVTYASATAATEPENLAYATRLGLWGTGTAFPTARRFTESIKASGVASMELVARDMKSLGVYAARSLSFKGVSYDRIDHVLSPEQRECYDTLCEAWQIVFKNFNKALELTASKSTKSGKKAVDGKTKGRAMSQFWGAQLRFFNYIVTSLSLPTVIADIEKEIAAGHCAVLQIVNTNEASQDRYLSKLEEDDDLGDLDLTPRDQIAQLVEHCFPVNQHVEVRDDNGNIQFIAATDSKGNPILNKQAVAMREALLDRIAQMKMVPDGPLEMIISHFGPDMVAEVTGRSRRVVRIKDEQGERTVIQPRSPSKCMTEAEEFQADKRRILIFSDAGGTGKSYHADRRAANQRRRIHYLIQPGWVADQAVQGFGRTHRSDQTSAPIYKLVSTDLKAQARFISSIARRLDTLGALTRGERKSAKSGLFERETDNLESSHAREALLKLYRDVHRGEIDDLPMSTLEDATGLKFTDDDGNLLEKLPPISRFLNRMLALQIERQNKLFSHYMTRLESVIQMHLEAGTLDVGTETIKADVVEKMSETVVYTHSTGSQTKLVELRLKQATTIRTFDDLMEGRQATWYKRVQFFARNVRSGIVWAMMEANSRTNTRTGSVTNGYRALGAVTDQFVPMTEVDYGDSWEKLEPEEAKPIWDAQVAHAPAYTEHRKYLICGLILPIFDRLKGDCKVFRTADTKTGERFLGRSIPAEEVRLVLENLGVATDGVSWTAEEVASALEADTHTFRLANSWLLRSTRLGNEVSGPDSSDMQTLRDCGVKYERINYEAHYMLGEGEALVATLGKLLKHKPVASATRTDDD